MSDFVNISLGNYSQVETTNLKVTSSTVLIEYEIFNLEKGTIKVVVLKL